MRTTSPTREKANNKNKKNILNISSSATISVARDFETILFGLHLIKLLFSDLLVSHSQYSSVLCWAKKNEIKTHTVIHFEWFPIPYRRPFRMKSWRKLKKCVRMNRVDAWFLPIRAWTHDHTQPLRRAKDERERERNEGPRRTRQMNSCLFGQTFAWAARSLARLETGLLNSTLTAFESLARTNQPSLHFSQLNSTIVGARCARKVGGTVNACVLMLWRRIDAVAHGNAGGRNRFSYNLNCGHCSVSAQVLRRCIACADVETYFGFDMCGANGMNEKRPAKIRI